MSGFARHKRCSNVTVTDASSPESASVRGVGQSHRAALRAMSYAEGPEALTGLAESDEAITKLGANSSDG